MFYRSERLFLRPAWPEDWVEILDRLADEGEVLHETSGHWPFSVADAMAFARQPQAAYFPHFLITLPSVCGATVVGTACLQNGADGAALSLWVSRQHTGCGYATEAGSAVLAIAQALGHNRIVAAADANGAAISAVLHKLGFSRQETGETFAIDLGPAMFAEEVNFKSAA